jgi:hypothetical protein
MKKILGFVTMAALISGCELLGTTQPLCQGQQALELPRTGNVSFGLGLDGTMIGAVPALMKRTGAGKYQITMDGEDGKPTVMDFEFCRIGGKSYAAQVFNQENIVFKIDVLTSKNLSLSALAADDAALKRMKLPFTSKTSTGEGGIKIKQILVDNSAAGATARLVRVLRRADETLNYQVGF